MNHNAEAVAQAVREHLVQVDQGFLNLLDIQVDSVTYGRAVCTFTVREDMLNSGRFCHGGFIFFLADHTFAYASLSKNQTIVTLSAHIVYTYAAKLGDRLTATAQVVTESGRTGSGDVEVVNQDGEIVARFQGVSYRRREEVLPTMTSLEGNQI